MYRLLGQIKIAYLQLPAEPVDHMNAHVVCVGNCTEVNLPPVFPEWIPTPVLFVWSNVPDTPFEGVPESEVPAQSE